MSQRWDQYFMDLCSAVSRNCRCPARQLGAVITRGNYVVSTGYNGPPAGFPNPGEPQFIAIAEKLVAPAVPDWKLSTCTRRALGVGPGKRLGLCPCAHAERNAISAAARCGVLTMGCTLYLNNCIPCVDCAYDIINAGIVEVVALRLEVYPQEGITGDVVLRESGVKLRKAKLIKHV